MAIVVIMYCDCCGCCQRRTWPTGCLVSGPKPEYLPSIDAVLRELNDGKCEMDIRQTFYDGWESVQRLDALYEVCRGEMDSKGDDRDNDNVADDLQTTIDYSKREKLECAECEPEMESPFTVDADSVGVVDETMLLADLDLRAERGMCGMGLWPVLALHGVPSLGKDVTEAEEKVAKIACGDSMTEYTEKQSRAPKSLTDKEIVETVHDLDKEMTEAETEEKVAEAACEDTMAEYAEKRRQDSKSFTDKEAAMSVKLLLLSLNDLRPLVSCSRWWFAFGGEMIDAHMGIVRSPSSQTSEMTSKCVRGWLRVWSEH